MEGSRLDWFRIFKVKDENKQMEYIKIENNSQFFYKVASAFLIAFFIFLSVKMFQAQSAQLMLIIVIFSRLWPRFMRIQSNLEQLHQSFLLLKSLLDLQNECNESN